MGKYYEKSISLHTFTVVKDALKVGVSKEDIRQLLGISMISLDRIEKAETYIDFDNERKARSAKIRKTEKKKAKKKKANNPGWTKESAVAYLIGQGWTPCTYNTEIFALVRGNIKSLEG